MMSRQKDKTKRIKDKKTKKTKRQKDKKTKDKDQKESLVLRRQGSFAILRCCVTQLVKLNYRDTNTIV